MVTQGVLKPRRILCMISTDNQFQHDAKTDAYQVRMIKFGMENESIEKNYFIMLVQCREIQNMVTKQLLRVEEFTSYGS